MHEEMADVFVHPVPVKAVVLYRFEVLLVDVLIRIFQQWVLHSLLCVPGLGPWLQALFYCRRNALVMGWDDLGTIAPVDLTTWGEKNEDTAWK